MAVNIIKLSYENTDMTIDKLRRYKENPVYDGDLWIFIDKAGDIKERPLAFGLADFDSDLKEGILEWIQVAPNHRGKGLGTFLVRELLNRLKARADFVTVSGDWDNPNNPINLYRKSGFVGENIWYIGYEKF